MKFLAGEREALQAILPLDLALYLRTHGWKKFSEVPEKYSIWVPEDSAGEMSEDLLLPLNPDYDDYTIRIAEALDLLAAVESRTRAEVLHDVKAPGHDVIRIARQDSRIVLSLEESFALIRSIRELLLSAACTAIEPSPARPPRIPGDALDYVRRVEIALFEGQCVEIRSPVTPDLSSGGDTGPLSRDEGHYERRVMETLMASLEGICEAVKRFVEEGEEISIEDLIGLGVSEELCTSLVAMQEATDASAIAFSVRWSVTRSVREPIAPSRVSLLRSMIPTIRSIADELKLRGVSQISSTLQVLLLREALAGPLFQLGDVMEGLRLDVSR